MKANKKGLVVKFLTTLILALIIFVPTCLFASNFFRLSNQAKSNFGEFVAEVQDFAEKGREGETKSFLLIMDEGSFIVLFTEEMVKQKAAPQIESGTSYGEKNFAYPEKQCGGKQCFCLCREYRKEKEILCDNLLCAVMEDVVFADSWLSIRTEDNQRRSVVSLTKKDGKVLISGGLPLGEEEQEVDQGEALTEVPMD